MNTIKKYLNLLSFLLSSLILFQSCRVYHRDSVTLDEAIKSEKRIKIKTTDNKVLKFKKLTYEDGEYYGIKSSIFMNKINKIPIQQNELKSIRLHNKTLSIIYGISVAIISTLVIGFIIALSQWSFDLDFSGMQTPM